MHSGSGPSEGYSQLISEMARSEKLLFVLENVVRFLEEGESGFVLKAFKSHAKVSRVLKLKHDIFFRETILLPKDKLISYWMDNIIEEPKTKELSEIRQEVPVALETGSSKDVSEEGPLFDSQKRGSLADYNQKLIVLDVNRTKLVSAKETDLVSLLNCIGTRFPSIGYYQGLNFYGGFLLEFTQDVARSRAILCYMCQTVLQTHFANSFQNLKCLFFVLDRLVEAHLPRLSKRLKSQSITSRCPN